MRCALRNIRGLAAASILTIASTAFAGGSQTWNFDLTTTGNNVFFTSPTAVDPNADLYLGSYVITNVIITGTVSIFPVGPLDVTNQIDPALLAGSGQADGPAPVTIFSDTIIYPPPPDPPGIAATVTVGLNAAGFGTLSATNVTLGPVTANVPPFGTVTINLTSVRIIGTVTVDPENVSPVGDLNGDGIVNGLDLGILLINWSIPPGSPGCRGAMPCPSDLNGDGQVNGLDLGILLGNWTI